MQCWTTSTISSCNDSLPTSLSPPLLSPVVSHTGHAYKRTRLEIQNTSGRVEDLCRGSLLLTSLSPVRRLRAGQSSSSHRVARSP
eukprot:scaffold65029_cov32-Tisochrysis_lutea.AAC.7